MDARKQQVLILGWLKKNQLPKKGLNKMIQGKSLSMDQNFVFSQD